MMSRFSRRPGAGWMMILLVAVFSLSACATQPPLPEPQPLPAGKDFTGVWFSPQFEHMNLRQTGDRVAGVYTYRSGGRIEGSVQGNMLTFTWVEPGSKERATRTLQGKGYLMLTLDTSDEYAKAHLHGEWGYNEDLTGGGPWSAEWVRDLRPEDPLTLENLKLQR